MLFYLEIKTINEFEYDNNTEKSSILILIGQKLILSSILSIIKL